MAVLSVIQLSRPLFTHSGEKQQQYFPDLCPRSTGKTTSSIKTPIGSSPEVLGSFRTHQGRGLAHWLGPRGSCFTVTAPGRTPPLTSEGMPVSGEAALSQGPPSCLASPGKASVQAAASPELKSLQFPSRSEGGVPGHMQPPGNCSLASSL